MGSAGRRRRSSALTASTRANTRRSRRALGVDAVLGLSGDYHDAAAALVVDGEIVAAVQEERFTRVKHDPSMPRHSARWCLEHAGLEVADLRGVVFYDKPLTTYERLLATHATVGPRGFPVLARALPSWSRSKLWARARIESMLPVTDGRPPPIWFAEHHQSHAASAFYPSPFESAAVLTFDGVGEWATSSIGHGTGRALRIMRELRFPDSLGLLYSSMTAYCGFDVNDGESKLMGLAPYGSPRYEAALRDQVVDVADDGSLRLNQRYFDYRAGSRMTRPALAELLDGPPSVRGAEPGQREADIARSVQAILDDVVVRIGRHARHVTREPRACLAGGVALNCVANARLVEAEVFDEIWVQPAAGDAGGALGAALWGWHVLLGAPRRALPGDALAGAALGPEYGTEEVATWLTAAGIAHEVLDDADLHRTVARELADGATVGWFDGRAEFGPRALGHRSILADPRDPDMVRRLNLQVKGREPFRPFAPAVLAEDAADWFELRQPSPYMLLTMALREEHRTSTEGTGSFADRLAAPRSAVPACTHIDHSARVQTVDRAAHPGLHGVISEFKALTGCPMVVNTSFNAAGEPIVLSPADALRCFDATGLDLLVLQRCLVRRVTGRTSDANRAVPT